MGAVNMHCAYSQCLLGDVYILLKPFSGHTWQALTGLLCSCGCVVLISNFIVDQPTTAYFPVISIQQFTSFVISRFLYFPD